MRVVICKVLASAHIFVHSNSKTRESFCRDFVYVCGSANGKPSCHIS